MTQKNGSVLYADLDEETRQAIVDACEQELQWQKNYFDGTHAAVCAAAQVFRMSNRAWNGKRGTNAYATAIAVLVHRRFFKLVDPRADDKIARLEAENAELKRLLSPPVEEVAP